VAWLQSDVLVARGAAAALLSKTAVLSTVLSLAILVGQFWNRKSWAI